MAVIRIPPPLRSLAGGAREVRFAAPTVGALLDELIARYPGFAERLRAPDGTLYEFVNLYVGGDDIRVRQGLATPLGPEDKVFIIPAVSGGR